MNSYSKSSKSSSSKSSSNNKPFCKVCYDAGKPEREYTSHYVKNKPGNEGKVLCPYLLSLVCTYCKKQEGHTAKHCPVLFAKSSSRSSGVTVTVSSKEDDDWTCVGERKSHSKKLAQQASKQYQNQPQQPQTAPVKQKGTAYSALSEIMDQEEHNMLKNEMETIKQNQAFPILRRNLAESPVTPPSTSGKKIVQWSTIVKSVPKPKPTPVSQVVSVAEALVTTPIPTDKDRASFRVIQEEDDYMSDDTEEEECAAVSGSGDVYGNYSTAPVTSSGNWGDDVDDY